MSGSSVSASSAPRSCSRRPASRRSAWPPGSAWGAPNRCVTTSGGALEPPRRSTAGVSSGAGESPTTRQGGGASVREVRPYVATGVGVLDGGIHVTTVEVREPEVEAHPRRVRVRAAEVAEGGVAGVEEPVGIGHAKVGRQHRRVGSLKGGGLAYLRGGAVPRVRTRGSGAGLDRAVGEEVAVRAAVDKAVAVGGALVGGGDQAGEHILLQHRRTPEGVVALSADAEHQRPGDGDSPRAADRRQLDDHAVVVGGEQAYRVLELLEERAERRAGAAARRGAAVIDRPGRGDPSDAGAATVLGKRADA